MINSKKRLKIVYCCNDKVFYGLYLSILSIIKRTKNPIDFYLLSANLTELNKDYISLTKKHESIIKNVINKYNKQSTFKIIDCKKQYYKRCGNKLAKTRLWPPYTTFRMLLDTIKELKGLILYLDTDTMACSDINQAFDVDMDKYELCVCHDIKAWDRRLKKTYFNAGSILINLDMARKTNYFKKAFKYFIENKPLFLDQDALNWTWTSIRYWDNETRFDNIKSKRDKNTVIQHFCGKGLRRPKPWEPRFVKKYIKYDWIVWKEDIEEFNAMKAKLENENN